MQHQIDETACWRCAKRLFLSLIPAVFSSPCLRFFFFFFTAALSKQASRPTLGSFSRPTFELAEGPEQGCACMCPCVHVLVPYQPPHESRAFLPHTYTFARIPSVPWCLAQKAELETSERNPTECDETLTGRREASVRFNLGYLLNYGAWARQSVWGHKNWGAMAVKAMSSLP